jgi:hypothetical protein
VANSAVWIFARVKARQTKKHIHFGVDRMFLAIVVGHPQSDHLRHVADDVSLKVHVTDDVSLKVHVADDVSLKVHVADDVSLKVHVADDVSLKVHVADRELEGYKVIHLSQLDVVAQVAQDSDIGSEQAITNVARSFAL